MRIYSKIAAFIFSIFALAAVSIPASAQPVIVNGGFETGTFAGWTVVVATESGGDWNIYQGDQFLPLPPPPEGQYAATTFQGGPGAQVLYQDIAVPVTGPYNCSLIVYYVNEGSEIIDGPGFEFFGDPNQQARIDLTTTDADPFTVSSGILENLFLTVPGDPQELGYTTIEFNLSAYAGTTVRLRAGEVDNLNPFLFAIDEVTCGGGTVVTTGIPTLGEWGMMAMAGVLGIAGLLYARRKRAAAV